MFPERVQPIPVVLLTLTWMAMWGDFSVFSAVSGVALAITILLMFPLPRLTLGLRLHPVAIALLLATFLADVVRASLQMSWLAVRPGPPSYGSEVEVELRSESDFIRTLTAEITTLVPGSVIVDLTGNVMRMHVIDVHTDEGLAEAAGRVLRTERRIRNAFGDGEPT